MTHTPGICILYIFFFSAKNLLSPIKSYACTRSRETRYNYTFTRTLITLSKRRKGGSSHFRARVKKCHARRLLYLKNRETLCKSATRAKKAREKTHRRLTLPPHHTYVRILSPQGVTTLESGLRTPSPRERTNEVNANDLRVHIYIHTCTCVLSNAIKAAASRPFPSSLFRSSQRRAATSRFCRRC